MVWFQKGGFAWRRSRAAVPQVLMLIAGAGAPTGISISRQSCAEEVLARRPCKRLNLRRRGPTKDLSSISKTSSSQGECKS